ncbi:MAG: hydroxymethylglutaryl-CoA lyase, partial [Ornithinimicrobium sp.]
MADGRVCSMSLPMVEPRAGMPERITIYEVGPRDGLQNESSVVPTEVKADFIRRLVAAGLETVEVTSFVPQRWVPQLGDAAELIEVLGPAGLGRRRPVLVSNKRGLERAPEDGVSSVGGFGNAPKTLSH